VGQKLGEGSFGQIYVARSVTDHRLYALKTEPVENSRGILNFEISVLKMVSPHPSYAHYVASGESHGFIWLAMELLGPSLSSVTKRLPNNRLSLSSGLRAIALILDAIRHLHSLGFIHRDIKPSNILLRRVRDHPIALIDFGLSRIYVDRRTRKHLPARTHPGFRGTAIFASPNAHAHQDLSRRDDLISWYYLSVDIIAGPLPWKRLESRAEILHLKRRLCIRELAADRVRQLATVWDLIASLEYESEPDYAAIAQLLDQAMAEAGVSAADEWDWHPQILSMTGDDIIDVESRRGTESPFSSEATLQDEGNDSGRRREVGQQPLLRRRGGEKKCRCCSVA
jgi:serine/threonine protein kinase